MKEQRFFPNQQPVAAQPPPNANQFKIEINWQVAAGKMIEICLYHGKLPTYCRDLQLKTGFSQEGAAQFALDAGQQTFFAFRSGRRAS